VVIKLFRGQSNKHCCQVWFQEEFEDTKVVIRIRIEEEQTTQWPKEKGQKDKQRSTKHTYKSKNRVTRTPLKPAVNSCAPEGYAVPARLVVPVVLIYLQTPRMRKGPESVYDKWNIFVVIRDTDFP